LTSVFMQLYSFFSMMARWTSSSEPISSHSPLSSFYLQPLLAFSLVLRNARHISTTGAWHWLLPLPLPVPQVSEWITSSLTSWPWSNVSVNYQRGFMIPLDYKEHIPFPDSFTFSHFVGLIFIFIWHHRFSEPVYCLSVSTWMYILWGQISSCFTLLDHQHSQ
jgi:hypothetical protein